MTILKFSRKTLSVFVAAVFTVTSVYANSSNSVDAGNVYKSSRKTNDLKTIVSQEKARLRRKLSSKGYTVADGFTNAPRDLGSETAVEELYVAFKEAFALAVVNLIMEETKAKLASNLKAGSGSNLGSDPSRAEQCKAEFIRKEKAEEARKKAYEDSALGALERISENFTEKDVIEDQNATTASNEELSKLIACQVRFKAKEIKNTLEKSVSGDIFGVRLMDTRLSVQSGEIGVIVGRSPESAKDAGILAGQKKAAKPNPEAYDETYTKVQEMIANYESENREPPFGIFGVKGFRISGGEMVYVGFGTAIQKQSTDELDSISNSLSAELADTKALAALLEFSYMTASSDFKAEVDHVIEKVINETLDMAKQGEKVDFTSSLERQLRATLTRDVSMQARGFIKAPQSIDNSAWNGGDYYPDFYLSAWAWSPSLMTNAMSKHDAMNAAYEEGKRTGGNSSSSAGSSRGSVAPGVKSFKVQEDW